MNRRSLFLALTAAIVPGSVAAKRAASPEINGRWTYETTRTTGESLPITITNSSNSWHEAQRVSFYVPAFSVIPEEMYDFESSVRVGWSRTST